MFVLRRFRGEVGQEEEKRVDCFGSEAFVWGMENGRGGGIY